MYARACIPHVHGTRVACARTQVLYARLWHALLLGDADGIRAVSLELGVGEWYPLLAAMLTGRPWADVLATEAGADRLRERGTAEDKAQIAGYDPEIELLEHAPHACATSHVHGMCIACMQVRAAVRAADRGRAGGRAAADAAALQGVMCMACSSMHPMHVCTRASR